MMTDLMNSFPPSPQGQVSLANWRTAPFNRWAFQHVREIVPSADIANDPSNVRPLPAATMDIDGLRIPDPAGPALTLDAFLQGASTDALVVLRDGRMVIERYANGVGPRIPHILMSVSKSLLGLVAGIRVRQGQVDTEALVTTMVPELIGTAYEGATVRHLLDMRAGVAFDEDYMATSGRSSHTARQRTGTRPLPESRLPTCARFTNRCVLRMAITAAVFTTSRPIATFWAGGRAGNGPTLRRLDERPPLEAHGRGMQRLCYRGQTRCAAMRGRDLRDGPRSRPCRTASR
jgi:hypothetical protein